MSSNDGTSISHNRSALRDFLASIATIRGDLSNITAPPFVLATKSTVEFPQYWAENPSIFLAPAFENGPQERALLVLKWFLSSLKGQQYAGRSEDEGVKKPLNAFLGELFLGHWEDEHGVTRMVAEQVSHHPPVTATVLWNDDVGITAEGYTRQQISFNGSVNIKQIGHAILTLTAQNNEAYFIPLPNVKVKGILTGAPHPELTGSYKISSTSGYTSNVDFTPSKSMFSLSSSSSPKDSFHASLHHDSSGPDKPLYTISGQWTDSFTIHDCTTDTDVETFSTSAPTPGRAKEITVPTLSEQSPWESRHAWSDTTSALNRGDMQGASDAKSKLEQAQRDMRKREAGGANQAQKENEGESWERCFFRSVQTDEVFEDLARRAGEEKHVHETMGVWKVDWEAVRSKKRPYREGTPFGGSGGDF